MSQPSWYSNTVVCPYNKSHLILKERIQTHLVKCARNHPDIVLKKCPFNVCHLLQESQFESHILQCEDRASFDLFKYNIVAPRKVELEPVPMQHIVSETNWDNENHRTYNPQKYIEQADVIRTLNLATPSEKKTFREAERLRLKHLYDTKKETLF